jgi:hypothetical protein
MFVHVAVHRPFTDKADLLAASMQRFAEAMIGQPGLQDVFVLRDPRNGTQVGLAIWDSKANWEAARPAMIAAIQDDPFGEWEDAPPDVFHLDVLWHGRSEHA